MVKVDVLSGSKVRIEIEVTSEQLDLGLDHAFEHIKEEVEIKGFRKGNVPRAIYEQKFGVESLYEEALNHIIQETYVEAVTSNNVEVVAQPKIDLDITKVEKGKGFTYVAEVAVKPVVTLGEYKGLKFEKLSDEVTEEQVQAEIAKLLEQNAELVLKEEGTLESGDTAIFDFDGYVDDVPFDGGKAENYELLIGSGQFIPGFEDQMIGMALEEAKDIQVTFPEEYQAENLKGKAAIFKVKLHEMKVKQLPELTDELVVEMNRDDAKTVTELHDAILKTAQEQLVQKNKNIMIDFAVEGASKNATFEIAEEMILEEKNRLVDNVTQQAKQYNLDLETYLKYTGLSKEAFDANLMKDAKKSLSYNLVVEAVAKAENITATKEEIEEKYNEIATQYKMDVVQVRAAVNEEAINTEVSYRKAIDFLVENLIVE